MHGLEEGVVESSSDQRPRSSVGWLGDFDQPQGDADDLPRRLNVRLGELQVPVNPGDLRLDPSLLAL